MADLRLVVVGCLMLVAFAQGKPGDVLYGCFFTPFCEINSIDDIKALASDFTRLTRFSGGLFEKFLGCIDTVQLTGDGTGCYDDKMVENTKCERPCEIIKNKLKTQKCYRGNKTLPWVKC